MDRREAYREKLDAQLKELKTKIDRLESRVSTLSAEAKAELSREIHDLRGRKMIVREKWNELQKSGGEAWDAMREGVDRAVTDLKDALERVISRFR
jgi:chromosome segregation ATPase